MIKSIIYNLNFILTVTFRFFLWGRTWFIPRGKQDMNFCKDSTVTPFFFSFLFFYLPDEWYPSTWHYISCLQTIILLRNKYILKIVNWINILLGNNHLSNILVKVITIKMLFASAKPLAIANCRGEFRGLICIKFFCSKVRGS